jgi:hypothetical protein
MTGEQLGIPPAALHPSKLHQAARAYYAHGWSVVPAKATEKRAIVPWRQWQTATPDLAAIDRWWQRWPWANVAVVTGQTSGIVVIDLDVHHGAGRSLAELEAAHGGLPMAAVVETPSGGWHVYLKHPRFPVANSASRLGPGIDVRGDRGLALLPPSHRQLTAYRWAVGGPETVPNMPLGWRRLLRPLWRPKVPVPHGNRPGWWEPGGHRDAARLAGLLRALEQAPEGRRNATLYWAGKRLAELLEGGAPESWVDTLVRAGVATGLEEGEVRGTVASALGRRP